MTYQSQLTSRVDDLGDQSSDALIEDMRLLNVKELS